MKHLLESNSLIFCYDDDKNSVELFSSEGNLSLENNSDFFRVFLDDGVYREITVKSTFMRGKAVKSENELCISYDSLKDGDGKNYNIKLVAHIKVVKGVLVFFVEVYNEDNRVRVNEIQYPYFKFDLLFDQQRERDVLLLPYGLGKKIQNPWTWVKNNCHTEYMSADYNQITFSQTYPFPLSMSWYGVISGNRFLYLGRQDDNLRLCALNVQNTPRKVDEKLILSISHYPAAVNGEHIICGETHVTVFENWIEGSAYYSDWARKAFYNPYDKPDWVKKMTGWQRVICKHQYGEVFLKYKDLVRVWKDCKKYGLTGILVFGWWKGCFDNHYPEYEVDEELGGEEELRRAIKEIQLDGGQVLLYSQGVLIDAQTEYYKTIGQRICRKDIDGNEYREFYQFSNDGTLLSGFGYKTFVSACQATDEWKTRLLQTAKMKLSFHPDCIFFDQVGGHMPKPCFDKSHKHGNRIDGEALYRCENLKEIHNLIGKEQAVGTENTVDCFSPYVQFHHGHMTGAWYTDDAFPQMFRQTFPEEIISNRLLHDDRDDMLIQLYYAFTNGLIFDVSIYRARKAVLGDIPDYGEEVKKLISLRNQYSDFFYNGKFKLTEDYILPKDCYVGEYYSQDGRTGFAVWNNGSKRAKVNLKGNTFYLEPQSVDFFVL